MVVIDSFWSCVLRCTGRLFMMKLKRLSDHPIINLIELIYFSYLLKWENVRI